MSCYKSRTAPYVGGIFIAGDGSRRVVPDQWLHEAKIEDGLLRLCYSSCTMEVRGRRLDRIFDDAVLGRLGTVTAYVPLDDANASDAVSGPFVTSIVYVPMSPLAASDLERSDDC